jgi:hypothetical protein
MQRLAVPARSNRGGSRATMACLASLLTLVLATVLSSSPATAAAAPRLSMSSSGGLLGLPIGRLVFSTVATSAVPAKKVTLKNTGTAPLLITGIQVIGTNPGQFPLVTGQAKSLTIAAGQSATIGVNFLPTAPTGCPSTANPTAIASVNRSATLSFTTNESTTARTVGLGGINSCANEGMNEPVLSQIVQGLGYTTVVYPTTAPRRSLGGGPPAAGTDEVSSPYFVAASSTSPVTLTPVAHYGARTTTSPGSFATGWYSQGSAPTTPCNASCHQLWRYPPDTAASYLENQKLLPVQTGTTTFTPTGGFGLYSGDGTKVNFSDDTLNTVLTSTSATAVPTSYLHSLRVLQAYGPGHVAIANTYLVAVDDFRVTATKNYDYQDNVFLLRNASPAAAG